MIQNLKASIQEFLQRQQSSKEVVALLQQHLDVRPVPSSIPALIRLMLMVLEMIILSSLLLWESVLPYGALFGIQREPSWLALSLRIRLIGGSILLILAIAALVLHLLLPVARPFFNYFAPLGILASWGPLVACLNLAYVSLPLFGYPRNHNAGYLALLVGGGVGVVIFFLFFSITQRKEARVSIAQARIDLLQTHLALEEMRLTRKHLLKRPKKEKNMTALEKATQADIPRFYLARHPDGTYTVAFKADLPIPIMKRLAEMQPKTAFNDQEMVKRVLAEDAPCEDIWTGKIYTFPEPITLQDSPNVTNILIPWDHDWEAGQQEDEEEEDEEKPENPDVGEWDALLLAYVVNERIVAGCRAQKTNEVAAEAWVQPEPSNEKEARQVTLAWASAMQRDGKIPFFSHHIDDEGAADLARGLGLTLVAEEVDYY